jgi:hypothetical protein
MKRISAGIILVFCLAVSALSAGDKVFQITVREDVLRFTGAVELWNPGEFDRLGFETAVRRFVLHENKHDRYKDMGDYDRSHAYIIDNLSQYTIEYAGVELNKERVIFCNMFLGERSRDRKGFTLILDGGCSVVQAIYHPQKRKIVSLRCNGVA